MTTKKIQIISPVGDVLHPETESSAVLMQDGRTLETALQGGGVTTSPTPPSGTIVDRLWVDTSDDTAQGTIFGALNAQFADNLILLDYIKGTIVYPTIVNGQINQLDHKNGSTIIRSDVFTYDVNLITEVRTIIATGKTVTLKYHTDTFQTEVI